MDQNLESTLVPIHKELGPITQTPPPQQQDPSSSSISVIDGIGRLSLDGNTKPLQPIEKPETS